VGIELPGGGGGGGEEHGYWEIKLYFINWVNSIKAVKIYLFFI
jgi:hypothetical protein